MIDLAIRNVKVLDGSGSSAFAADIGVDDGRIHTIGTVGEAKNEIDGEGRCAAPGLIDTHAHDDGAFFRHPGMEFKLAQGVTTVARRVSTITSTTLGRVRSGGGSAHATAASFGCRAGIILSTHFGAIRSRSSSSCSA